jgi:amidohydrolase
MTLADDLKRAVIEEVDRMADLLFAVSHDIHARPELNYEEHYAHDRLTGVLEDAGLPVTRHAYGVDTAFEATVGDTGPAVAVLLEYDALPGIGHACGHNVIAAAGLGAGLAAAKVVAEAGGRLRITGTPAEEGGGGKIRMARNGAFADLAAALMVHPADADLVRMDTIAVQILDAEYHGVGAHAAAAPWEGRNALDAAVLGYMAVAALRQHIRPSERVHGVFSKGGDKPNIVPEVAATNWFVRSDTIATLQPLKQRVLDALQSGAGATGCTMQHHWNDVTYADLRDSSALAAAYTANAVRLGRTVQHPDAAGHHVVGSTDMGNVSYLAPSIHPMIKVAADGVPIHTADFAAYARGATGDAAVLDGAKLLAMTAIDVWCDAAVRDRAASEFGAIEGAGAVLA